MQREIDALREAQKLVQQRLREMEMSNDDMERNDRSVLPPYSLSSPQSREILAGGCPGKVRQSNRGSSPPSSRACVRGNTSNRKSTSERRITGFEGRIRHSQGKTTTAVTREHALALNSKTSYAAITAYIRHQQSIDPRPRNAESVKNRRPHEPRRSRRHWNLAWCSTRSRKEIIYCKRRELGK
jgi:hypothetical protein